MVGGGGYLYQGSATFGAVKPIRRTLNPIAGASILGCQRSTGGGQVPPTYPLDLAMSEGIQLTQWTCSSESNYIDNSFKEEALPGTLSWGPAPTGADWSAAGKAK